MAEVNHTDVVRERVLKKLIYGEYAPGHVFKLREMLEDPDFSGMSQTPVREALLQLVAKDILTSQRGFSVRVPMPSVEHLTEVRAIRTQLEIMAALKTLGTWTPEKLAVLQGIHKELIAAKAKGATSDILSANVRFHFGLYGEGKSYLLNMITTLWAITGPSVRYLYTDGVPSSSDRRHSHEDVMEGLKTGNPELVAKGIRDDLSSTGDRILEVLRKTVSPEAQAIKQFEPIQLVRARERRIKSLNKKEDAA
ncbi:GntR family transcriptional regulator [Comamonas testosteroni]|uniref:GntR family transcriptional regulator n=1 Tax=Comamonas testosteroni TaxID=285 RepID=UPI0015FCB6E8|nr:GntR family transcriptional regulator [Comamonas testosteroni]